MVPRRDPVGIDACDLLPGAGDPGDLLPDVGHGLRHGGVARRVAGPGSEVGVAVLRRDDEIGVDLILDRLAVRVPHPRSEHGHEGDERDADHQRGRGRSRPAWVAARVALRELPGGTAQATRRPADDRRDRPDQLRREQCDPEEEREDAEAEGQQPLRDAEVVGEERVAEQEDGEDDQHSCDEGPVAVQATGGRLGAFAHRRDRRHPRRAERRREAGDQGDDDPDQESDDHRAEREDKTRRRQLEVERLEERVQPLRESDTEEEPDHRCDQTDRERLEEHRGQQLPPRRAERPQRRQLTRSLRDGDRQRVEDDEGADEECDRAEGQQEVADDAHEDGDLAAVLVRLLDAGLDLNCVRQVVVERGGKLVRRRPALGGDGDGVELALPVEQLLRRCDVEDRERSAAERLDAGVLGGSDELEVLHRREGRHLHLVAHLVALILRRPGVDDDLVRAGRPTPVLELERVEPGVGGVDTKAEGGRVLHDRLAAVVEDLHGRLLEDAPDGGVDLVVRADLLQHRCGDRRRRRRLAFEADVGRRRRHDSVSAGVGLDEDPVERTVDRVREDERPADHRDAEDDGDRGQNGPELPAREAPKGDPDHVSVTSRIVSRICSSPAPPRSLTMLPSARNRTRSADEAARASCVTITIVWP